MNMLMFICAAKMNEKRSVRFTAQICARVLYVGMVEMQYLH